MPIRTGLDERMTQIRLDLKEYFGEAKDAYSEAIEAFTKMDSEVYDEVKSVRKHARVRNWDLSNNLLLILAINQPLMEDLRIVATYLRTVDTVERVVRHARDIARSDRSLDTLGKDIPALPDELVAPVLSMWSDLSEMIDILCKCLTEIEDVPKRKLWILGSQFRMHMVKQLNLFRPSRVQFWGVRVLDWKWSTWSTELNALHTI